MDGSLVVVKRRNAGAHPIRAGLVDGIAQGRAEVSLCSPPGAKHWCEGSKGLCKCPLAMGFLGAARRLPKW